MKRYILLAAILLINIAAMAQNYLGKSLATVEKQLIEEGIDYKGYVNEDGTYSIKYYKEEELRIYVFDYSSRCNAYIINFDDPEKVYKYGVIYTNNGWKQVKLTDNQKEFITWEFINQKYKATCIIIQNEDNVRLPYLNLISVGYK